MFLGICQFGLAHVDGPKGDLDGSKGYLSGPNKNVVVNDQIYPYGTTEKYPAMMTSDAIVIDNSGHEYRECSNKGYCNRNTGMCDCFPGYEGSACQRTSCPSLNDLPCNGHGKCQTAKEIANKDNQNVYLLWDADISQTCVCDSGYFGPSCEQRACKSSFDPIYREESPQRYSNWSVLIVTNSSSAQITGNYSFVFYDIHNQAWESPPIEYNASCLTVVESLESFANNIIPKNSIRCLKWNDFQDIEHKDEPFLLETNPYYGIKYTLTFPQNPGILAQPSMNQYLDGKRPTIYTNEKDAKVFFFVYSNGFSGETTDYFPSRCEGVDVTIEKYEDDDVSYHYLSGLTAFEHRLLSRCLGDSDGDLTSYSASEQILGNTFQWDYGDIYHPHLIRLSDLTVNKQVDLCLGVNDSHRDQGVLCSPPNNLTSTSFYAPLMYDSTAKLFKLFTKPGLDYDSLTKFAVFTTSGYLQMVSENVSISMDQPYSQQITTFLAINETIEGYDGDLSCEHNNVNEHLLMDCLEKSDIIVMFDPYFTLLAYDMNPLYLNMYSIARIGTSAAPQIHTITLDKAINGYYPVNEVNYNRIYHFFPPSNLNSLDSNIQSIEYVSPCANRGLCDESQGICQCFEGFTGDACTFQHNLEI